MSEMVRIPDGDISGYLEHGADPAEQAAAEAASRTGDPETYERALERQRTRKPVVRVTGRPLMTLLTEALDLDTGGRTVAEMVREERWKEACS